MTVTLSKTGLKHLAKWWEDAIKLNVAAGSPPIKYLVQESLEAFVQKVLAEQQKDPDDSVSWLIPLVGVSGGSGGQVTRGWPWNLCGLDCLI